MTVAFMKPAHNKYCTRHWKSTLGKSLRVMRDRWFSSPYGVTQLRCRILTGTMTRYPRRGAGRRQQWFRRRETNQGRGPRTVQSLSASVQYRLPDSDLLPNCGHSRSSRACRQASITHITEARKCRRFSHFTLCPNTTPLRANDTQHL